MSEADRAGQCRPETRIEATGRGETAARLLHRVLRDMPRTAAIGWSLALRQTQGEMRGNQLGLLWLVLSPLLYVGAYLALRAGLGETVPGAAALPGGVFAIVGIVIFQSWFDALIGQFTVFQRNAPLLRSIGMEPEILFFSGLATALFATLARLAIALGAALAAGAVSGPLAVLGFFAAALAALVSGGALGFAIAPLGVLVEDLRRAVQSLALLLMVGSGAFFAPAMLEGTVFRDLLALVPPASFVEVGRSLLLDRPAELWPALLAWSAASVGIGLGAAVFLRLSIRILAERFQ
ncbi:MAG: hypothetical protein AAF416_21725 [Pseudomonadota bacterium]